MLYFMVRDAASASYPCLSQYTVYVPYVHGSMIRSKIKLNHREVTIHRVLLYGKYFSPCFSHWIIWLYCTSIYLLHFLKNSLLSPTVPILFYGLSRNFNDFSDFNGKAFRVTNPLLLLILKNNSQLWWVIYALLL